MDTELSAASFLVNGNPNPDAHEVAFGATVSLALASVSGVNRIEWSIVSSSKSGEALLAISPAGSPLGATATLVAPADPGDDIGRSWLVKCLVVTNGGENVIEYGLVGVPGAAGVLPIAADEGLTRNATHGIVEDINAAIAAAATATAAPITQFKEPVRLATTTALPAHSFVANVITMSANGALSIDGTAVAVNDRVLVKDESTSHIQHGIYAVTAAGSGGAPAVLTRATDWDSGVEFVTGTAVLVTAGTANEGQIWYLATAAPITLNTTALQFLSATADAAPVIQIKSAVNFATIAALPAHGRVGNVLTASANGALLIDGVAVSVNQRALIKNEASSHLEHGIYTVTATGDAGNPWILTRATDWDAADEFEAGTAVLVLGGNTQSGQTWYLATTGAVTLNTTALEFRRSTAAATLLDPVDGVVASNVSNLAAFTVAQSDRTYIAGETVLLSAQATGAQNRVYTVGVVGGGTAPLTARDASFGAGSHVYCKSGKYIGTWNLQTGGVISVGSTALTWRWSGDVQGWSPFVNYVAYDGSDSNDGRTRATAKLTVRAAYQALYTSSGGVGGCTLVDSGNSASPFICIDPGDIRACLKIMPSTDPQWVASPGALPTGWEREMNWTLRGIGCAQTIPNATIGGCDRILGGSLTDIKDGVVIWLAATNANIKFENISFSGGQSALRMCHDSTLSFGVGNDVGASRRPFDFAIETQIANLLSVPVTVGEDTIVHGRQYLLFNQGGGAIETVYGKTSGFADRPVGYNLAHAANGAYIAVTNGGSPETFTFQRAWQVVHSSSTAPQTWVYGDQNNRTYRVQIDGAGARGTATFKWNDTGSTTVWNATGVPTAESVSIGSNGAVIRFSDTHNYAVGHAYVWNPTTELTAGHLFWVREGKHAGLWVLRSPQGSGTMGVTAQEYWKSRRAERWDNDHQLEGNFNDVIHVTARNCAFTGGLGPVVDIGYVYWSEFVNCRVVAADTHERSRSILRSGILIASEAAASLVCFRDIGFTGGGIVLRVRDSQSRWEFRAEGVLTMESGGWGLGDMPPVLHVYGTPTSPGGRGIISDGTELIDGNPAEGFDVIIEGNIDPHTWFIGGSRGVKGACIRPFSTGGYLESDDETFAGRRQFGYDRYGVKGQHDAGRATAAMVHVPSLNLVSQDLTSWSLDGTATRTTGITDRFGRTDRAVRITTAASYVGINKSTTTRRFAVGDWVMAGVWFRGPVQNFPGLISFVTTPTSFRFEDPYLTESSFNLRAANQSDAWQWISEWVQIKTIGTADNQIKFALMGQGASPHEFFGPVLYHLPASQYSTSRAAEIYSQMCAHSSLAPVGTAAVNRPLYLSEHPHLNTHQPTAPAISIQSAAGTGATGVIVGTDSAFTLQLTNGPDAIAGRQARVTLAKRMDSQPVPGSPAPMNQNALDGGYWWQVISPQILDLYAKAPVVSGTPQLGLHVIGGGRVIQVPEAMLSLRAWWRADTVVSGGGTITLTDKTGNGLSLAQATAGEQATFVASSANFNSRPTYDFDGVDDNFEAAAAADWSFIHNGTGCTIVHYFTGGTTSRVLLATNRGGNTTHGFRIVYTTTGISVVVHNGSGVDVVSLSRSATITTGKHFLVFRFKVGHPGAEASLRVDNLADVVQLIATGTPSIASPLNPLCLGAQLTAGVPGIPMDCEWPETMIFNDWVEDTTLTEHIADYVTPRYALP